MTEPAWISYARRQIGIRETPGTANEPRVMAMAKRAARWLGAAYAADSVPWCGLFVADCMAAAGFTPPRAFVGLRAKAWSGWGIACSVFATRPPLGAIAVFGREGGGHVGFVVGAHSNGDLDILGGNQGDAVNIRRFPRARLIALRWPAGVAMGEPVAWAGSAGTATTGEA